MTSETEKIIDEMIIRAQAETHGTYEGLQNGIIDRNKWRSLLRRRVIEAVESQFKSGIELSDIGAILHPGNMINLLSNYNENGEPVKYAEHRVVPEITKGRFMNILCKELRRLIPDDQPIDFDYGDSIGVSETNGIDIGVYLLTLMKDIPDTTPVSDPRPCEGDPDYSDDTWETNLSSIGLEYPE